MDVARGAADIDMDFFILLLITASVSLILCVYIGYQICTKMIASKTEDDPYDKISLHLTIWCIFFHLLTNLVHPICYFFDYISPDQSYSFLSYLLWDIFWSISKMLLYAVFMYRLYMAFKDTIFEYNKMTVFLPLILSWILQCVLIAAYFVVFYNIFINHNIEEFDQLWIIIGCAMFALLDFVLCAVILYLFTNGIVKLVISMKQRSLDYASRVMSVQKNESFVIEDGPEYDSNDEKTDFLYDDTDKDDAKGRVNRGSKWDNINIEWNCHQHELLKTATHLTLLGVVAMFSSFIYQILWLIRFSVNYHGLYYLTNTWSIDIIINIICLFLSMAIAHKHYHLICVKCCKLHQLCFICVEKIANIRTRNKFKAIDRMRERRSKYKRKSNEMRDKDSNTDEDVQVELKGKEFERM